MENRIQINGTWYVKETSSPELAQESHTFDAENVTRFEACVYETDDYCWEASRIQKEDGTFYKDIHIKFKNKTVENWQNQESEYWDNNSWLLGVFRGDPGSLAEAHSCMNKEGVKTFRQFISYLVFIEWIK